MNVFIISEVIDLGVRNVSAWINRESAEFECYKLNVDHANRYGDNETIFGRKHFFIEEMEVRDAKD